MRSHEDDIARRESKSPLRSSDDAEAGDDEGQLPHLFLESTDKLRGTECLPLEEEVADGGVEQPWVLCLCHSVFCSLKKWQLRSRVVAM